MQLLTPIQVGKTTFKNRIMFPPITTGFDQQKDSDGEQTKNFYKRIAQGGAGYIVIGDVTPTNSFGVTLYKDEQISFFRDIASACHEFGAKLGLQLFYREFDDEIVTQLFNSGRVEEAREKIHFDQKYFVDEVPAAKFDSLIDRMKQCVLRAAEAGVDVIQIHGDRLNGALLSTSMNNRTDEYGGSFKNRTRFALRMVAAVKEAVSDMPVEYKLSVRTETPNGLRGVGGLDLEESKKFAAILESAGCDMIHVGQANHTSDLSDTIPPMGIQPYGFTVACTEEIKRIVCIPVSCVGRIITPRAAESLIHTEKADMVGLGRSLLCDPDFPNKCLDGKPDEVRTCMMCNRGCTDNVVNRSFISCVLNAESGYEYKKIIKPANKSKKICVIGAGIAGLEASRVLALKGHSVDLYEKGYRIGGQLNLASVPPRKEEMKRAIRYYSNIIPGLKIKTFMGVDATDVNFSAYDEIVFASGAENLTIPVEGSDNINVVSAWDVLDQKAVVFGRVAVIGGGLVGAETAEYLANKGCKVSVVEMLEEIAGEESSTIRPHMMKEFKKYSIEQFVRTKLKAVKSNHIICVKSTSTDGKAEVEEVVIPADFVVMAVGAKQNKIQISQTDIKVHYIGDCSGECAGDINRAVTTAYDAANSIN